MLLKLGLLLSMLFQLAAAIVSISLIRKTKLNISWVLISLGLVLMAVRRLFDFSTLFWDSPLFVENTVNPWIGILISLFMLGGVLFINQIFSLQKQIDRIKAENETKVLTAVLQAEERARQKFARELHDGLGPMLASVKMTLSALEERGMNDDFDRQLVNRSVEGTENAIRSLKDLSNLLSPHLLTNYGLETALETIASQLFGGGKTRVAFSSTLGGKRFSELIEINVFRILTELMTNSLRHAHAATIQIHLSLNDLKLLVVKYEDDGIGFDQIGESESGKRGMGIQNIRSRVKSLNGTIDIFSEANKGVSADLKIPLQ